MPNLFTLVTIGDKIKFLNIIAAVKMVRLGLYNVEFAFESIKDDLKPQWDFIEKLAIAVYGKEDNENEEEHRLRLLDTLEEYRAQNFKGYLSIAQAAGIQAGTIDIAKSQSSNAALKPFIDAYSGLHFSLRFDPADAINFLFNADEARIAALPSQCHEMHQAMSTDLYNNIGKNSHNPDLEEIINGFLNRTLHQTELMTGNTSTLQKWWKYDDLVTEDFKNVLRINARFVRLNALYGDRVLSPKRNIYAKFFSELVFQGISLTSRDLQWNFMLQFDSGINLLEVARLQILSNKSLSDFTPPNISNNHAIEITVDVDSCNQVIADFKKRGIIDVKTPDLEIKIAALQNQWPEIANKRILNPDFSDYKYVAMYNKLHEREIISGNKRRLLAVSNDEAPSTTLQLKKLFQARRDQKPILQEPSVSSTTSSYFDTWLKTAVNSLNTPFIREMLLRGVVGLLGQWVANNTGSYHNNSNLLYSPANSTTNPFLLAASANSTSLRM